MTLTADPTLSPKSFPLVEIGDLVEFRRGLTYKKSDEVESSNTGVLRANNVDLATGQLDLSDIRYLTDKVEVPQARKLATDSLLICTASGSRAHLGKMAHIANAPDLAFGGFMGLLVPKPEVSARYIWYFSRSEAYRDYLDSLAPGANINNLRFDDLAGLVLPLPSIDEQKRIVAVLDQAFAALDRARANAVVNVVDAEEIFLRATEKVLEDLIREGSTRPLADVAEHCLGKMLDKNKNTGRARPYLRNINVRWFEVDQSDVLEMRIEDSEVERYSVRRGDLLICEGGYPGRAAIYDSDEPTFFQKALHRVRFESAGLANVVMYWLYVQSKTGALNEHFSGTGIQHFTGQTLARFHVPVASERAMRDAAHRLGELRIALDELSTELKRKQADITDLRQSLLQAAFSGQLT